MCCCLTAQFAFASAITTHPQKSKQHLYNKLQAFVLKKMQRTLHATSLTPTKTTWQQKLIIKLYQRKLKKATLSDDPERLQRKARTAYVLGLVGLVGLVIPVVQFFSIPLAIIALVMGYEVKAKDKYNSKAKSAIIFGYITLGLFVLAAFLIIALLLAIVA
jgi:hypothetical protein